MTEISSEVKQIYSVLVKTSSLHRSDPETTLPIPDVKLTSWMDAKRITISPDHNNERIKLTTSTSG
jgi:hypothetical protein